MCNWYACLIFLATHTIHKFCIVHNECFVFLPVLLLLGILVVILFGVTLGYVVIAFVFFFNAVVGFSSCSFMTQ